MLINPIRSQKRLKSNVDSYHQLPSDWESFTQLTKIRSGSELKTFNPYEYQKRLIRLAEEHGNVIVLKSRQLGITQAVVSKFLHSAIANPAFSSVCFLRNGDDASAVSRRARQMLTSIPDYAKADSDNVGYLKIKNGGDIYFKNSGKEGSRSLDSISGQLYDEAGFVENIKDIYAASNPSTALSDNVMRFIVSTPSAKSGFFWEKLTENNCDIEAIAVDVADGKLYKDLPGFYYFRDGDFCKVIIHWRAHPIYSQIPNYLEYRLEQDASDMATVMREYDLRFMDTILSQAFRHFTPDKLEPVSYNPQLPLIVGVDFNLSPATALFAQKWKNKILIFDELYLKDSDTFQLGDAIARRISELGAKTIELYGDATGNNRTANSQVTNWQIIHKKMPCRFVVRYGKSNPLVKDAVNSTNHLFIENRLVIDPGCVELIKDLELLKWDGSKFDKRDGARSHLADILKYICHGIYPYQQMKTAIAPSGVLSRVGF